MKPRAVDARTTAVGRAPLDTRLSKWSGTLPTVTKGELDLVIFGQLSGPTMHRRHSGYHLYQGEHVCITMYKFLNTICEQTLS